MELNDKNSRTTVIIADDEPITRMDIKEIFIAHGYDVVAEASDGFDAVESCKKYHPDLVLLDIKMPLADGLSAAKIINEDHLADTIIMLTAYSDKEFVEQAKLSCVSGYIVKPIDEKSLIPSVEVAVARNREINKLRKDIEVMTERLENRTVIEKAKGLIMQEQSLSEQEAYDYIRELSHMKNISMRRVSEIILARAGM